MSKKVSETRHWRGEGVGAYGYWEVDAYWDGGAYVELFGGRSDEPYDVLNVFDHESGEVRDESDVREVVEQYFDDLEEMMEE